MLATVEEMQARWGKPLISRLSQDDTIQVKLALQEASAEITSRLAGHYIMPPSPVPAQLRGICLLLALGRMYDPGSLPKDLGIRLAQERDQLSELAEGVRTLGGLVRVAHPEKRELLSGDVRFRKAIRKTSEDNLKGFGG